MKNILGNAQKNVCDALGAAKDAIGDACDELDQKLKELDSEHAISDTLTDQGNKLKKTVADVDTKYQISDKARKAGETIGDIKNRMSDGVGQAAEVTGLKGAADIASAKAKEHELDKRLKELGHALEDLYGSARYAVKPYSPPQTPEELLLNTKKELAYISACIMQVSRSEAEGLAIQFGNAVTSKIAGFAASGALLSLVSTFGTAGTGTAIAGLSGAASTSASLAWVGGLLGGGMATGAVLTGGVGLVVGLGAYKALSSEKRHFEDLSEIEQRIVQYCWMLISIIDQHLQQKGSTFVSGQAKSLLNDTLLPLYELLKVNEVPICNNLDSKNAIAFRQHVLRGFKPEIIQPFQVFIATDSIERTRYIESVIGGVFYALLTQSVIDASSENQLVLDALRRSDSGLLDASESELSSYLANYNEEQLKGIANNIKGIYHELLWVKQYNADHADTRAELYEATNQPGADVRIVEVDTGNVIAEYQLKATNSVYYVGEHKARYTEIEIIVTSEVADAAGATDSGFSNENLTDTTAANLDALAGNTVVDRTLESAGLTSAIAVGQELLEMLHGRKEFPEAVQSALKKTGAGTAATAVTAYLFS